MVRQIVGRSGVVLTCIACAVERCGQRATSTRRTFDGRAHDRPVHPKFARQVSCVHATLKIVGEEPEIYAIDFSDAPGAAEFWERLERARTQVRRRYHDYLAAVFDLQSSTEPGVLADVALDALTLWRRVDSGERCGCSCHPQLPESDFHDYGFGCVCARTPEDRRSAMDEWRRDTEAFWKSPAGRRIVADEQAAEADLLAWLAVQLSVVVHSHGGFAPEQWCGEVDGHAFYFRERHDEWRIELALRPSGRFARVVVGIDGDGAARYKERELDEGDVIARGTTDIEGYGTTPAERAKFIVDMIRMYLAREACNLHVEDLSSIEVLLGREVRWCPACGIRLT
jgi:hypothetical protein